MKKRFYIVVPITILLVLLTIGYLISCKDVEEIQKLLSKSETITNMYVEHYVDNGEYINNVKSFKINVYIKDNIYIYEYATGGNFDYVNFDTNECFSINDNGKHDHDISVANKFNDLSTYFNSENYAYSYVCPCYVNGTWCDKIEFKRNTDNYKLLIYINKENGLVMKQETIIDNVKRIEIFDYQINTVTDEQIKEILK